jgi:hypothetical protein
MMQSFISWASLVAVAVGLAVGGNGCGRVPEDASLEEKQAAAFKLPGATNIFSALERKDYEGALAAYAKVKESLSTDEQQIEFAILTGEVKTRLMQASDTDPKAAEALNALRAFATGR